MVRRWPQDFKKSEISVTSKIAGNPNDTPPVRAVAARHATVAIFQMNHAKLYVPVVTLSINDNIIFLENIKLGFKITISWKKYRSEIRTQPNNNNLDRLIMSQNLRILIDCLYFHSEMVMAILLEIHLIDITCHW